MELFFSDNIGGGFCHLAPEESNHCIRVLRHREGDEICVIDGLGTMYRCRLTDASPKGAAASILESFSGWGAHPYRLVMAVCPTKNAERYEWFTEKATELGVDTIVPVIGSRSERRVFKTDRLRKIALSAAKQSLKAAVPEIAEPVGVTEFIESAPEDALKLIACCFDDGEPRLAVSEALAAQDGREVIILIGPEGDFSPGELRAARERGFVAVHLGASRLRTETAALTAVNALYLKHLTQCI